jgi:hypothetical protein
VVYSGKLLGFPEEHLAEVIKALEGHGYTCVRNEEAVDKAGGA